MSKGFDHLKKLSEWVVVDDRVRQSVIGAGFGAFLDLSPPKHDHALLSSLVEHYDVSERCFVFNDVKLHFGLEDVWHITGLPIDGEAVTGVEGNSIQLSEEYLGENLCEGKRGAIKLSTLKNRFQNVPVGIDSSELTYYIRAYLLYVLGTSILPDKSGSLVPTIYLPLLEDIEKVHHYAWGAALLAHLHVALANCKKQGSQSIMGHTFSLLVFVLLRILKILRLSLRLGDGEREDLVPPIDFPLAVGWSKVLFDHSRSNYNKATREDYSRILDSLQDDDITWQPYIRPQALPLEYYSRQQLVARSRTVLICYEKAVYHRPDVAPKQFGYKSVVVAGKMIDLKVSGRSGPKKREGKDWSKKYDEYVSVWKRRTSPGCLIEEEVVVLENAAGEASVEGTFSQGGDACQTNEQGKVVVLENVGGEASVEATFSQGGDACQTDEQGGDSKTLMFAQISPSEQDLKETLCSLNFATPIQGVELDLEKMQIETSELQNWKMKFEELERKLKEKQHNSELALHQKVEELERELKGRYDAESLLHQKVEELERKLKEKQHNSEPALHQKCEDLKVKYNEEHEKRRKLYDQVQDVKGMLSMSLEEVLKEQHFQLSREAHECASSDPDWTEIISAVQCLVSQREDLKVKYNEEHEKRRKLYDQNQEANGKFSMSLDKVIKELEDMLGDLSFQN